MSSRNNQNLVESKSIAQKEFELNRLKELTINGIKLIHADRFNFTVEQNNSKGYFGTLRYALRRFYILLHGKLTIKFENFADEYADVKPHMPCSLIDVENIKRELLEGVTNEKA